MSKEIGLHDLVKGIRKELQDIMEDPEIKSKPMFKLKDLEFEVAVIVSKAGTVGLKFMLLPVGINGEAKFDSERISKIKITFEPLQEDLKSLPQGTIYTYPEEKH